MTIQNEGATTPSEKFSAKRFDRSPRHAGLVEFGRVAPDEVRDRFAAGGDPSLVKRVGDPGDMDEKTALGKKRAGDEGKDDHSERQKEKAPLDDEGNDADNEEERQHRHGAPSSTRLGIGAAIQAAFEPGNQPAHPGDGMADRTREPIGVADRDFDQQCKERERREHGISPRSYAARPWRRPRPFLDLSTGINPHPEPVAQLSSEVFVRMPQPEAACAASRNRRRDLWGALGRHDRRSAAIADP